MKMPSIDVFFLLQYAIPILLPLFLVLFHRYHSQLSPSMKKKFKNLPPSPTRLPIIGNLHQLDRLPHQGLRSLARKYGDIVLLQLGSKPTLVVSSAEGASQVLKTHDLAFCSKPRFSYFTRILYNGKGVIASPYGGYWRQMRSICVLELLSNRRVQSFRGIREEEVAIMVDDIKKSISSSSSSSPVVINMREVLVLHANNLISRMSMGTRFGGREEKSKFDPDELIAEMMDLMGRFSIGDFVPWLTWIDRLTGVTARVEKLIKTLDDYLEGVIAKHSIDEGQDEDDRDKVASGAPKDVVNVLLELQKGGDHTSGQSIDRDSIKAILLDMFVAGTETTSTSMEWLMSEILINPKVLEQVQQEVREVSKGKGVITEDDLKDLVYLKAVMQEALRLHPPVSMLTPRECIKDVQINGYDISAGTLLFVNAWAIGRDPRYWDEPESFRPERFLSSSTTTDSKARHDFGMIPFGSGRRGCPGEASSRIQLQLVMANLMLQFDWALPFGVEKEALGMQDHPGITTGRTAPLLAIATPALRT